MDDKKIPFKEKSETEKPLFPEIYMDKKEVPEEENKDFNLKYSNRMLF